MNASVLEHQTQMMKSGPPLLDSVDFRSRNKSHPIPTACSQNRPWSSRSSQPGNVVRAQTWSTITWRAGLSSKMSAIKFDRQCSVRVKFVTRPLNPEITFQTSNSSRGLFLTFLFYLFNRIEIIIFQNDSITVREHSSP